LRWIDLAGVIRRIGSRIVGASNRSLNKQAEKRSARAEKYDERGSIFRNVMGPRAPVTKKGVIHASYRAGLSRAAATKHEARMHKAVGWQLYWYGVATSRSSFNPVRWVANGLAAVMRWRVDRNAIRYGRNRAAASLFERSAERLAQGGQEIYDAKAGKKFAKADKQRMLAERSKALLARQVPTTARNAISIFESLIKNHQMLKMAYVDYRNKLASEAAKMLKAAKDARKLADKLAEPKKSKEIARTEEQIKIYENAIKEIKNLAPPSEFISKIEALRDKVQKLYSEFIDSSTTIERQDEIAQEIELLRSAASELDKLNKGLVYGVTVKTGKGLTDPEVLENVGTVIELLSLRRESQPAEKSAS